tara:strand:+ start:304 stop:948 length:645 start_codon:yes stop_codon:yes gene_type:complete
MGFAVHSLGNRKNNMLDTMTGSNEDSPSNYDSDSESDNESGQMIYDTNQGSHKNAHAMHQGSHKNAHATHQGSHLNAHARLTNKVASVQKNVPKPVKPIEMTDPKDLLPKDKSDTFNNRDLINAGRFISQQADVLRNANLQLRSDPPVGKEKTGPFNQPTIEPDLLRPHFELGGSSSSGGITGFGENCPMWQSASIKNSSSAILPPSYKNLSSE